MPGRKGLDRILPEVSVCLSELMAVLACVTGLFQAPGRLEAARRTLQGATGFEAYLAADWDDLVGAFATEEREKAVEVLARVMENVLARLGLYVEDLDDGQYFVHVGEPR